MEDFLEIISAEHHDHDVNRLVGIEAWLNVVESVLPAFDRVVGNSSTAVAAFFNNCERFSAGTWQLVFEFHHADKVRPLEEDPARMKLYYAPFMFDEDAEFQVRDVIKLKKLPEDVYKLDSKTHTGHFSYHADHRWAGVADIYRVKDVPEWIKYNQVSMDFTILLQDDRIMVLCQYNEYWESGVTDVYYDEWPQIQFEEKDTIGSIYKKYNVKDPKKIELSDDLKTELIYTSGFERDKGSTIFSPEVYKTSDQADA